jgi:hypothetical protein
MERESTVLEAQGTHDLGSSGSGQGDGEGFAAQPGAGGREARDSGGGELRERWFSLGEVVGEESGLPLAVVLDYMATDEVAHKPGADDLQQVRDGGSTHGSEGLSKEKRRNGEMEGRVAGRACRAPRPAPLGARRRARVAGRRHRHGMGETLPAL